MNVIQLLFNGSIKNNVGAMMLLTECSSLLWCYFLVQYFRFLFDCDVNI